METHVLSELAVIRQGMRVGPCNLHMSVLCECTHSANDGAMLQEHLCRLSEDEQRMKKEATALYERERRVRKKEEEVKVREEKVGEQEGRAEEKEQLLCERKRRVEEREEKVGEMEQMVCQLHALLASHIEQEVEQKMREERMETREQLATALRESQRMKNSFSALKHSNGALKKQVSNPQEGHGTLLHGWSSAGGGGFGEKDIPGRSAGQSSEPALPPAGVATLLPCLRACG